MEPGHVLATFVNLEVLVEHGLGIGVAVVEDEPSLLHAQNARSGLKPLHRRYRTTLPRNVNED